MSAWSQYLHGKRSDVNACCPFSLYLCTHHNSSRLTWGHRNILMFSWAISSYWPNCVKYVKIHVRMEGRKFCLPEMDQLIKSAFPAHIFCSNLNYGPVHSTHFLSLTSPTHNSLNGLKNLGTHSEIFAISFVEWRKKKKTV